MIQDASKLVMGATGSTAKEATCKKGDFLAGLVLRLKSDDTLSIAKADGGILGVSLGKDLSNAGFTSFVRKGLLVPVLLTSAFTPVVGAVVNISDTTGKAGAAGAGFTAVNAIYAAGLLSGLQEDGTYAPATYIDMPGGL